MARKAKQEEAASSSFTVLFTSLSVILLAFFILLNSMATLDDKRTRAAFGSLTAVFSGIGSGPLVPRGDSLVRIGNEYGLVAEGPGKLAFKVIKKKMEAEGLGEAVSYEIDGEDVLLVFADNVFFDSGKAHLKPEMTAVLDVVAAVVLDTKKRVVIEGHTDNRPIHTALYPSNWELSTARAGAAARYLLERHPVAPDDVSCEGHGEFKPVADNATAEGRAKNRRVVVRFVGMAELDEQKANNLPQTIQEKLK